MPRMISSHALVGEFKDYYGGVIPPNYILCDGSTIGNTGSGATYTGNYYQDLFNLIWSSTSNSVVVILTSGGSNTTRGANAAADWAANKRLPIPDSRRRAHIGAGGSQAYGGTGSVGTSLGNTGGEEAHTLLSGESGMPTHSHSDSGHSHGLSRPGGNLASGGGDIGAELVVSGGGNVNKVSATSFASIANASPQNAGSSHNNMPPSLAVTKMIRY